jgi:AcrR family transcriptional regulator
VKENARGDAMEIQKRRVDRRVQRTRQVLQQAFREIVREKGFAAISIQDITERANVNRGTFYLHFADKYMLLDAFIREDIQHLLSATLPATSHWNRQSLRLLIQTMLEYFERKYRHQRRVPPAVAPLIERVVHEELTALLLTWLKRSGDQTIHASVPPETIARIVGWAIFGAVIEWSQEETTVSLERMTDDVLLVVQEGVARLVSDVSPE